MSAARVWAELAAAGSHVRAEGDELVVRHRRGAPAELRAAVPVVAPKLLAVASGRWRLDLASWPAWRLDHYQERAAIMADQPDVAPELVEQLAYLDAADQPDPVDHQEQDGAELAAVDGQKKLERFGDPAGLPPDVDPDDPATLGAEPPQHPGTASHGSPEPAAPVAPQHPADTPKEHSGAHARAEAWPDTVESWRRWLASAQPWRPPGEVRRILADVARG